MQVINLLGVRQIHSGGIWTGLMVVAQLIGFWLGGFAGSFFSGRTRWRRPDPDFMQEFYSYTRKRACKGSGAFRR